MRPLKEFILDKLKVEIHPNRAQMGKAAAEAVANRIRFLSKSKENVRMVFAAAPSQNDILAALSQTPEIDWARITAFHMDEYLGLPANVSQLFGHYLRQHIFEKVSMRNVYFINPEPTDVQAECERYSDLIGEAPIDIVCMGIGENGHIAFNDPPVANFNDTATVKVVELDKVCRQQQVNDGCFPTLADVPEQAITLTVPALMSADAVFVVVPGPTKTEAVYRTLKGPIATSCPASITRLHDDCRLFLDKDSAAKIYSEF
ncbi:MAG: glucosamine-6-phosphate deaminase [bacterium]